jgi:KDO2-lipid IV(A) lauroyltransferase
MSRAIDLAGYLALLGIELLVRSLPPRAAFALADLAGRAWYRLDGRRRQRARQNLAVAARGGLAVPDPEALVRRAFRELMRVPVEALAFPRWFPSSRAALRRCRLYGDWARLGEDLAGGRGGLFVSGHLGSWELAAWVLRFLQVPSAVVARPIGNAFVQRRALRARGGSERVLAKRGAARQARRLLASGGWVGILADQNAGARGVFVPFFGLPASTYALPAVLAWRLGVPVYACACLRRPGPSVGYELHLSRLPAPPADLPEADAVRCLIASFLARLEGWIHRAPAQYNWVHRRWRSRPASEGPESGRPSYGRV